MMAAQSASSARQEDHARRISQNERNIERSLELSREALLRLEGHETRCSDRYAEITKNLLAAAEAIERVQTGQSAALERVVRAQSADFVRVHERIDSLIGRWFWAACAGAGFLATVIGYLLTNGTPWQAVAG